MLKRKLWRDIKDNFGAYLAVTSVIIIGLTLYVSLSIILDNLSFSQQSYYQQMNFADGYANVVKAPKNITKDIENIEGIKRASGRIIKDVFVYKPAGEENASLRIVSIENTQAVNKVRLESGRLPGKGEREVLISPNYYEANHLKIGDTIPLILLGKEVKFTITGTGTNPEFIYEIPNAATMAPDPKSFGIAFTSYDTLASFLEMDGQVNNLVFTLDDNVKFEAIKRQVNQKLDNYGIMQLYPRKDQLSHSMLTQEILGLKASAVTTPLLFLFVAASILYIMLRRMVEQQRGQIGILKAFGFTNTEIIRHYLGYAVLIGFVGGLGGSLAGGALSYSFAKLYQQYFNIPGLNGSFSLTYIIIGTVASVLFSALAGFQGVKQILSLAPSEAMRPPAPKGGGKTLIEQITFIWSLFSTLGKMAIRNIFRSKQRTFLAIVGISSAFSMMVAAGASFDASDYLVNFQFDQVEKYDLKIGLNTITNTNEALTATKHLEGIKTAEPLLEIPVTMTKGWLQRDIVLTGLPPDSQLFNLIDNSGNKVKLPENGAVISSQLAKTLNAYEGDKINIKPFVGDKKIRQITIISIVPQYVGIGAYMNIDALSNLMNIPAAASSVIVKVDQNLLPDIREHLQGANNVASISDKTKMKTQFEELMASSKSTQFILLFFAFLTGFAIVYNVTLISLSEREREIATLLIMGMTEREVGHILVFEQGFMGALGILFGIPLSYAMLYAMVTGMANDVYNIPIIISTLSMLTGILGTISFLVVSQWRVKTKISKISMLDVLKQQE